MRTSSVWKLLASIFCLLGSLHCSNSGKVSSFDDATTCFAGSGRCFYVDATLGNDANTGQSQDQAWKSISKLNSTSFQAGDVIALKKGESWNESLSLSASGNSSSWLTIDSYGTASTVPTLNGQSGKASLYLSGSSYVQIKNIRLSHGSTHCLEISSGQNIKIQSITISNCAGPSPGGSSGYGIYVHGNTSLLQILSSTISGAKDSGIGLIVDQASANISLVTIDSNTISQCGRYGIEAKIQSPSTGSYAHTSLSNITITENTIEKTGSGWAGNLQGTALLFSNLSGAVGTEMNSFLVESNTLKSNLSHGIALLGWVGASVIQKNKIYSNSESGVYLQDDLSVTASQLTMRLNLLANNTKNGLYYQSAQALGSKIYNNTFYANGSDAGSNANIWIYQMSSLAHSVYNNLCMSTQSLCYKNSQSSSLDASFDYNLFYRSSGNLMQLINTTYTLATSANFVANSTSNFHSLFQEPVFTNTATNDFSLQSSSPGLHKGLQISDTLDIQDLSISQPPDLGAYQ
jgi:hypothetical protein